MAEWLDELKEACKAVAGGAITGMFLCTLILVWLAGVLVAWKHFMMD